MEMNVKDALSGAGIDIENRSPTSLMDAGLLRYSFRRLEHVSDERAVFSTDIVECRNMFARTNQHMQRGFGPYIFERYNVIILEDEFRRYFAFDDSTEQA
jgi:hypothetical protein